MTYGGFSTESGAGREGPLSDIPEERRRRVWAWAGVIAVGGFLFGFDTGVISGALLFIKTEFDLDSFEQGSVVSVLLIGAMIGALGSGRIADRVGRRTIFALEGVVFLLGTALAVFATGYLTLLLSRIILGLAVGAASATVPTYLGEVSPTQFRGRILTLNQLMITIGIMAAYLVNLAFSASGSWRAMFAVGAIPGLIMLAGALWMLPESPLWLLDNGRIERARKVMAAVSTGDRADRMIERFREREREEQARSQKKLGWRELASSHVRPALVVGVALAAIQQFGGINTIIYFAPSIMQRSGLNASNSIFYSVAIGVINLVMTVVALWVINKAGRRVILLTSLSAMLVTLAFMGLSFVAGWSSELSLLAMVAYIAAYGIGMGPLFWVMIGEIFPPAARATGSSAATATNWTSNFVVSLAFLPIAGLIGQGQTFWIFAVVCALAVWFVSRYVPETRNRDFPAIDTDLQHRFGRTSGSA